MSRRRTVSIITKYGFGFDELNDDYKVFVVVQVTVFGVICDAAICKVYSLRSNSWKDVELRDVSRVDYPGIYVSGKLHWYTYEGDIISFGLNTHVFGVVELPSYCLGAIGGGLSAHIVHRNGDLDVWVMKESWDKVVTVPYYDDPDY